MSTHKNHLPYRRRIAPKKKRDTRFDQLAVFLFFIFLVTISYIAGSG